MEIDPVVHSLATEYFALPKNHTAVIEDATVFVKKDKLRVEQEEKASRDGRYDYIVHDVFTGGAEPIDLFTVEFIQSLSDLLKPTGSIAIVCLYHPLQSPLQRTNLLPIELRKRPAPPLSSLYLPHHPKRLPILPLIP